ncbi:MAG: hypothetical protein CM1200mP21_10360 [Candidatus Poseidoniales archaeon]|nr:MAG: hypothetical protein CM1200mP21_10360 [Candidatus Poseidoniales archaeon]
MKGELFCRGHLTQKGDIEKLQCPRDVATYISTMEQSGYYHCDECKGAMLDAKRLETKLAEDLAINSIICLRLKGRSAPSDALVVRV